MKAQRGTPHKNRPTEKRKKKKKTKESRDGKIKKIREASLSSKTPCVLHSLREKKGATFDLKKKPPSFLPSIERNSWTLFMYCFQSDFARPVKLSSDGEAGRGAVEEDPGAGGGARAAEAGDVEADAARGRHRRNCSRWRWGPPAVPVGVAAAVWGAATKAAERGERWAGVGRVRELVEATAREPGAARHPEGRKARGGAGRHRAVGKTVPEHIAVDGAVGAYLQSWRPDNLLVSRILLAFFCLRFWFSWSLCLFMLVFFFFFSCCVRFPWDHC